MDSTKKEEMLQNLGTSQEEFTSYLAKFQNFITNDLSDGERDLHKQLGAQQCPPTLENYTSEEIGDLFGDMKQLPGLDASTNTCKGCL